MKYILLFILLFWLGRRILRLFTVVASDGSQHNPGKKQNFENPPKAKEKKTFIKRDEEYIDFEEID